MSESKRLDIFNRLARDLPEGYSVTIELERHSGYASLLDPAGNEILVPDDDLTLTEHLHEMLKAAKVDAKTFFDNGVAS